jgi:hypothetical protein
MCQDVFARKSQERRDPRMREGREGLADESDGFRAAQPILRTKQLRRGAPRPHRERK